MSAGCLCDACSHLLFHEVRVELTETVDLAWSSHLAVFHCYHIGTSVSACRMRRPYSCGTAPDFNRLRLFALSFTVWAPQPIVYSIVNIFYCIMLHTGRDLYCKSRLDNQLSQIHHGILKNRVLPYAILLKHSNSPTQ